MLDASKITAGSRVLDVAAGAGGQSLAAARRVGPTGHVLATDISPAILDYAAKAASDASDARSARSRVCQCTTENSSLSSGKTAWPRIYPFWGIIKSFD